MPRIPEAQTAVQGTVGVGPLASFATGLYYSPHTFWLVDAAGERQPRPVCAGSPRRASSASRTTRRRRAAATTSTRTWPSASRATGRSPSSFASSAPAADDPLDDPTALWPDEREQVAAGRLEITAAVDDPERDDHIDVFDPLRLPDGVEPSDDPILHARRSAYSVSAYRRWGRPPGPPPE